MKSNAPRTLIDSGYSIPDFTRAQIENLRFDSRRPLLISDADEVLVRFAEPLERFLEERGLYLDAVDYRLVGNIRRLHDRQPVERNEVFALIDDFFEDRVDRLPAVDGAVSALGTLSERADIVILTNVPNEYRDRRVDSFRTLGLDFPIVANSGLKGAAVRALADRAGGPVMFIDDIESHIADVAEAVPGSYRIHFVADPRLAAVCARAPDSHHRSDCWRQTGDAIAEFLNGAGH